MEALREITKDSANNHIYLLDGSRVLAYIPQGTNRVVKFEQSMRFDRRGRRFEPVSTGLFSNQVTNPGVLEVSGSSGKTYWVNTVLKTCTCPGFTYRGHCRHIQEVLA